MCILEPCVFCLSILQSLIQYQTALDQQVRCIDLTDAGLLNKFLRFGVFDANPSHGQLFKKTAKLFAL